MSEDERGWLVDSMRGHPPRINVEQALREHWLGSVWSEYDRIKLCDIIEAKAEAEKPVKAVPFQSDRLIYSPM